MRILAVSAHPDDLEVCCAGTLARYTAQGHQVVMVHACRGDKGHLEIGSAELAEIRGGEARAAAELIGAECVSMGFNDCEIYVNRESSIRFVDMIRAARPDLIITHHPDDYHGDHFAVTRLVLDASFAATLPNYATDLPPHSIAPPVFFMETLAGLNFTPDEYVDISSTFDIKMQAMACHDSQIGYIREHHHTDVLDLIETTARFRGWQCGATYAEGFQSMRAWGRISSQRLLP